jgi:hypothetical protein
MNINNSVGVYGKGVINKRMGDKEMLLMDVKCEDRKDSKNNFNNNNNNNDEMIMIERSEKVSSLFPLSISDVEMNKSYNQNNNSSFQGNKGRFNNSCGNEDGRGGMGNDSDINDKNLLCEFYLHGMCLNGDNCEYMFVFFFF